MRNCCADDGRLGILRFHIAVSGPGDNNAAPTMTQDQRPQVVTIYDTSRMLRKCNISLSYTACKLTSFRNRERYGEILKRNNKSAN